MANLDLKTTSMIQLVLQVNGRVKPEDLHGMSTDAAVQAIRQYQAQFAASSPMSFEGDTLVQGPGAAVAAPAPGFAVPAADFGASAAPFAVPEVVPTPAPVDFGAPAAPDFGVPAAPVTDFGVPAAPVGAPTEFGQPGNSVPAPDFATQPVAPDFGTPAAVPSAFAPAPSAAPLPAPESGFGEIPPMPAPAQAAPEAKKKSSPRLLVLLGLLLVVGLIALAAYAYVSGLLPFGPGAADQGATPAPVQPAAVTSDTAPASGTAPASAPATK